MQALLAAIGSLAAVIGWSQDYGGALLIGGLLLASVIPFTLLVILPTNKQLLDPALNRDSQEAALLLLRWGRLHLIRSLASGVAFAVLLAHIVGAR
jgi:uncharacterized membrane protein